MAIPQRPTTLSHDVRSKVTLAIVAHVTDRPPQTAETSPPDALRANAEVAVARLDEMSRDVRGCAILGPAGEPLAASGDLERWRVAAAELLAAADAAAGRTASHAHVATEDGEAFAVREGGLAIVAVSVRFTLASLLLLDMRTVLRDAVRAAAEAAPADREVAAPAAVAEREGA